MYFKNYIECVIVYVFQNPVYNFEKKGIICENSLVTSQEPPTSSAHAPSCDGTAELYRFL